MIKALVTAVGAVIGQGIIKGLLDLPDVEVVGCDIYDTAAGQKWCHKFIRAIPAQEDGYISFLEKIVEKEEIDILFFGTEQEVEVCNSFRKRFRYLDKCVLNTHDVIGVSQDKWKTYCWLRDNGIKAVIPTWIDGDFNNISLEIGTNMIVKPRQGSASKGIHEISTKEEFDYLKSRMGEEFMVQKIVGNSNEEYTVGLFGYGDGLSTNEICLKRILGLGGATSYAEVCDVPEIREITKIITSRLKPLGPTNYQFRMDRGKPYLLEINPRFSSSTSIRRLCGFNEAKMALDYWIYGKRQNEITIQQKKIARYIEDVVIL